MKKILIEANETLITVTLNETIAAKDFYSRLPITLKFIDSGSDYCAEYLQGKYTIEEMQRSWQNGDILWNGGFLSIIYLDEKYSQGYNVMVIGHVKKEDLKLLRKLPKEVLFEFKPA